MWICFSNAGILFFFACDTIDILSEFWFLEAFILSVLNSFCLCDRNSWWKSYLISRGTKRHLNFAFLNAMWLFAETLLGYCSFSGRINSITLGQTLVLKRLSPLWVVVYFILHVCSPLMNPRRPELDSFFTPSRSSDTVLWYLFSIWVFRVLFLSFVIYLRLSGSITLTGPFVVVSLRLKAEFKTSPQGGGREGGGAEK